jgi:hypothetical protein
VIERLEAIAAESATSAASIVRLALRQFLRDFGGERRVG